MPSWWIFLPLSALASGALGAAATAAGGRGQGPPPPAEALAEDDVCGSHSKGGGSGACGTELLQTQTQTRTAERSGTATRRPARTDSRPRNDSLKLVGMGTRRHYESVSSLANSTAKDVKPCAFFQHRRSCYINGVVCATSCGFTHHALNLVCKKFNDEESTEEECSGTYSCEVQFDELSQMASTLGKGASELESNLGGAYFKVQDVQFLAMSDPLFGTCGLKDLATWTTGR
jgi:hypothetical protein